MNCHCANFIPVLRKIRILEIFVYFSWFFKQNLTYIYSKIALKPIYFVMLWTVTVKIFIPRCIDKYGYYTYFPISNDYCTEFYYFALTWHFSNYSAWHHWGYELPLCKVLIPMHQQIWIRQRFPAFAIFEKNLSILPQNKRFLTYSAWHYS